MNIVFRATVVWLMLADASIADDCNTASDQATLNQCADQSYKAADTELNAAYAKIVARLADSPDIKARLVKAQKAWIAFRDAECNFVVGAVDGASVAPMIETGCFENLTRTRLKDFSGYLACEEGDLSCPVPPAP